MYQALFLHLTHIYQFNSHKSLVRQAFTIMPILQMRRLRPGEVDPTALGHIGSTEVEA